MDDGAVEKEAHLITSAEKSSSFCHCAASKEAVSHAGDSSQAPLAIASITYEHSINKVQ